jgi:hypothetical protein
MSIEPGSTVMYDASSVRSQKLIGDMLYVEAWLKQPELDQAEYPGASFVLLKYRSNCGSVRKLSLMQVAIYNEKGKSLFSEDVSNSSPKWFEPIPDTLGDVFLKRVCRIAYERHLLPKKTEPNPAPRPETQRRSLPADSSSLIEL